MEQRVLFLCLLILSTPFVEARRGGGGGGGIGRGSSGARTGVGGGSRVGGTSRGNSASRSGFPQGGSPGGGFQPNRGGFQQPNNNFGPQGGGFHPQQPGGGFHPQQPGGGFHQPAGGWNNRPSWSSGSSIGSPSRAGTFKTALAGAALGTVGGLLAFEAGKAIIRSATTPYHYGNRDYYFDRENYRGAAGRPMCSMPLEQLIQTQQPATTAAPVVSADGNSTAAPAPNQVLQNLQFQDGRRPREVVWSCAANEVCCGTECCPAPQNQFAAGPNGASRQSSGPGAGTIILLVIVFLLILCCLCCFCAVKFCSDSVRSFIPANSSFRQYFEKNDEYQPGQAYPMNSYPNNSAPQNFPPPAYPGNAYPPAPQSYPQQYPPYPSGPQRY